MTTPLILGSKVKDRITGFSGIITGTSAYLNGCNRSLVQPEKLKKDGTMHEAFWFDDVQLVVLKAAPAPEPVQTGGPPSRVA